MATKLAFNGDILEYDLVFGAPGNAVIAEASIEQDDELDTAVIISVLTDKRATPEDLAAAGLAQDADPRGSWGDTYPIVEGDQMGSHLWMLSRSLRDDVALSKAKAWMEECLQWMLDDGVAQSITVTTRWIGASHRGRMEIAAAIERPKGGSKRWAFIWDRIADEISEAA